MNNRTLQVANCGDSVALLCRRGAAHMLTTPHRASVASEQERIAALRADGLTEVTTELDGERRWRCAFDLEVTRAIGDFFEYPQTKDLSKDPLAWGVSATPEIATATIGPEDSFLIMATDGLDALKDLPGCDACGAEATAPRDESALTCLACESASWGGVIDSVASRLEAGMAPEAVAAALADEAVAAGGGCADNTSVVVCVFSGHV